MRFKNDDLNNNGALKEGFVLATILSAQELYVLKSGTTVLYEPSADELDYACIDITVCQSNVPSFTIERRISNPKKIKRLFDAANVQPEPDGNGYSQLILYRRTLVRLHSLCRTAVYPGKWCLRVLSLSLPAAGDYCTDYPGPGLWVCRI